MKSLTENLRTNGPSLQASFICFTNMEEKKGNVKIQKNLSDHLHNV
jgi:hypothetical protein